MAKTRKTCTAEFKLQAVRMAADPHLAVAEVARRLGLTDGRLHDWLKAFRSRGPDAFPGRGRLAPPRRGTAPTPRPGPTPQGRPRPPEKSRRRLRPPLDPTFPSIAGNRDRGPVAWRCETLDVSAAGYYAWVERPDRRAEQRRRELAAAVIDIRAQVRHGYGRRRMTAELTRRGFDGSEDVVATPMETPGIRRRTAKRFVRTTDSRHDLPVAASVWDRDFPPSAPNDAWRADIPYVPTAEGWLYLAVVEDPSRRRMVGWSMGATMTSRRAVDAWHPASGRRHPSAGLLAHSHRGRQYASGHDRGVLTRHGIACRMSGVGPCGDNAPMESFFAGLKRERDFPTGCTRDDARATAFEYLELSDNPIRRHSSPGYVSPTEYERRHNTTPR